MIAGLQRAPQNDVHVIVDIGISVLRGAAASQQSFSTRPSHIVFDLAHQAIDFDHYFFFPVNVPPARPAMSIVPFIDVGLSMVAL